MDFAGTTSGLKKLNNTNYTNWRTCIESYLQGQDLWEVVGGSETTPPEVVETTVPVGDPDQTPTQTPTQTGRRTPSVEKSKETEALRKWKIKAGKAMYVLKTTIEEELLVYIRDAATPKVAWDTLATLFSKKNDARLQLLESELMTISQGSMTINQYFTKVKSLCNEIAQLDPEEKISEQRMRRIIIHGLKPEYSGFIAAIRGWPTQPTLLELENLLANQEALARQIAGVSTQQQQQQEVLFSSRGKGRPDNELKGRPNHRSNQRGKPKERNNSSGGARNQKSNSRQSDDQDDKCYNCGKRGHYARDCRSKKKV